MSRTPRCRECGQELYNDEEMETGLCDWHMVLAEDAKKEELKHPDDIDKL